MKTLSPLLHTSKLLKASCSPEQTENLSYPCVMLYKTFWVLDPHCLDHMTSHISSSSWTTAPIPTQTYTLSEAPWRLWPLCCSGFLLRMDPWSRGAFCLWRCYACHIISKYFLTNGRRKVALNSSRIVNFYSVTPALNSTLLTVTSCGWWWYHLIVKGNCSVFWFYV